MAMGIVPGRQNHQEIDMSRLSNFVSNNNFRQQPVMSPMNFSQFPQTVESIQNFQHNLQPMPSTNQLSGPMLQGFSLIGNKTPGPSSQYQIFHKTHKRPEPHFQNLGNFPSGPMEYPLPNFGMLQTQLYPTYTTNQSSLGSQMNTIQPISSPLITNQNYSQAPTLHAANFAPSPYLLSSNVTASNTENFQTHRGSGGTPTGTGSSPTQ